MPNNIFNSDALKVKGVAYLNELKQNGQLPDKEVLLNLKDFIYIQFLIENYELNARDVLVLMANNKSKFNYQDMCVNKLREFGVNVSRAEFLDAFIEVFIKNDKDDLYGYKKLSIPIPNGDDCRDVVSILNKNADAIMYGVSQTIKGGNTNAKAVNSLLIGVIRDVVDVVNEDSIKNYANLDRRLLALNAIRLTKLRFIPFSSVTVRREVNQLIERALCDCLDMGGEGYWFLAMAASSQQKIKTLADVMGLFGYEEISAKNIGYIEKACRLLGVPRVGVSDAQICQELLEKQINTKSIFGQGEVRERAIVRLFQPNYLLSQEAIASVNTEKLEREILLLMAEVPKMRTARGANKSVDFLKSFLELGCASENGSENPLLNFKVDFFNNLCEDAARINREACFEGIELLPNLLKKYSPNNVSLWVLLDNFLIQKEPKEIEDAYNRIIKERQSLAPKLVATLIYEKMNKDSNIGGKPHYEINLSAVMGFMANVSDEGLTNDERVIQIGLMLLVKAWAKKGLESKEYPAIAGTSDDKIEILFNRRIGSLFGKILKEDKNTADMMVRFWPIKELVQNASKYLKAQQKFNSEVVDSSNQTTSQPITAKDLGEGLRGLFVARSNNGKINTNYLSYAEKVMMIHYVTLQIVGEMSSFKIGMDGALAMFIPIYQAVDKEIIETAVIYWARNSKDIKPAISKKVGDLFFEASKLCGDDNYIKHAKYFINLSTQPTMEKILGIDEMLVANRIEGLDCGDKNLFSELSGNKYAYAFLLTVALKSLNGQRDDNIFQVYQNLTTFGVNFIQSSIDILSITKMIGVKNIPKMRKEDILEVIYYSVNEARGREGHRGICEKLVKEVLSQFTSKEDIECITKKRLEWLWGNNRDMESTRIQHKKKIKGVFDLISKDQLDLVNEVNPSGYNKLPILLYLGTSLWKMSDFKKVNWNLSIGGIPLTNGFESGSIHKDEVVSALVDLARSGAIMATGVRAGSGDIFLRPNLRKNIKAAIGDGVIYGGGENLEEEIYKEALIKLKEEPKAYGNLLSYLKAGDWVDRGLIKKSIQYALDEAGCLVRGQERSDGLFSISKGWDVCVESWDSKPKKLKLFAINKLCSDLSEIYIRSYMEEMKVDIEEASKMMFEDIVGANNDCSNDMPNYYYCGLFSSITEDSLQQKWYDGPVNAMVRRINSGDVGYVLRVITHNGDLRTGEVRKVLGKISKKLRDGSNVGAVGSFIEEFKALAFSWDEPSGNNVLTKSAAGAHISDEDGNLILENLNQTKLFLEVAETYCEGNNSNKVVDTTRVAPRKL